MNENKLTSEQLEIINANGNLVVIAVPGSGKTTTITYKIKKILYKINEYQGIIAISYTNKASNELRERVSKIVPDLFNSFFGTIYSFYISEIIIPFAKYMFNFYGEIEIVSANDCNIENIKDFDYEEKKTKLIEFLKQGKVILEEIPLFANYIFDNSVSCQKYLKARYTHIFIDEYQDCDILQHTMFKKLVTLGIIGIAVGDPDQSIFKYSGSSPGFLLELSELPNYNLFSLSVNHRSHVSIINYAYKFLSPQRNLDIPEDKRVYKWNINGDEKTIAEKIDLLIPRLKEKFVISENKEIAILTRNNSTARRIFENLSTPAIYFTETPIDKSSNVHDIFCKDLLLYIYGSNKIFPENIIENLTTKINAKKRNRIVAEIIELKNKYNNNYQLPVCDIINLINNVFGASIDISNIEETLRNENHLISYKPLDSSKIHIMTIHKSKGLEFDAVFITDLHKFIIPKHDFDNQCYLDINEDKCIHYVSITRARKVVFLTINSQRHNSNGEKKTGIESEFVDNNIRNDLVLYRK